MKCLSIETSCDETSVAVLKDGRKVLSNIVSSQINIHKKFGGVVPEIASRYHLTNISYVVDEALLKAKLKLKDIDYVAVTYGPGLIGALLVGVSYAKALAYGLNKPIVPVHHIEGHIAANYISNSKLEPPFIALVVSGGHSHIVHVKDYTSFEVIARTRDDAVGEAFDKVARTLGLGYPGGPQVSKEAQLGEPKYILPKTKFDNFDFSFSGIKTAVINIVNKEKKSLVVPDMCASFEQTVCETLVEHTIKATKHIGLDTIVLAGGVSANTRLREMFHSVANKEKFKVYMPKLEYCTDNAAMIGCAAHYNYINGNVYDIKDKLDLNAYSNLNLGEKR